VAFRLVKNFDIQEEIHSTLYLKELFMKIIMNTFQSYFYKFNAKQKLAAHHFKDLFVMGPFHKKRRWLIQI
jgi:hypothetical protein